MIPGPLRFVRYALPPNLMGYCGPDRAGDLAGYLAETRVDPGLAELAAAFEGAWPYLTMLADRDGGDPLGHEVIDAYWLGGPLASRVPLGDLGDSLRQRFGGRAGWRGLRDALPVGGRPTHAYHVFSVYPWVGLMRTGARSPGLEVVDRCRVRWGKVEAVFADRAVVVSRPLEFHHGLLGLGEARPEMVRTPPGVSLEVGADVSLHWDWVCEVLDHRRLRWLETSHRRELALANGTRATASVA